MEGIYLSVKSSASRVPDSSVSNYDNDNDNDNSIVNSSNLDEDIFDLVSKLLREKEVITLSSSIGSNRK